MTAGLLVARSCDPNRAASGGPVPQSFVFASAEFNAPSGCGRGSLSTTALPLSPTPRRRSRFWILTTVQSGAGLQMYGAALAYRLRMLREALGGAQEFMPTPRPSPMYWRRNSLARSGLHEGRHRTRCRGWHYSLTWIENGGTLVEMPRAERALRGQPDGQSGPRRPRPPALNPTSMVIQATRASQLQASEVHQPYRDRHDARHSPRTAQQRMNQGGRTQAQAPKPCSSPGQ
jgi:hypothetical protein